MAEDLLHETQVTAVVELLREVVNMVTEESKDAVGSCVSFSNTPSTSPRMLHKTKLTGVEHEKVRPPWPRSVKPAVSMFLCVCLLCLSFEVGPLLSCGASYLEC